jgi:hypothetical protein
MTGTKPIEMADWGKCRRSKIKKGVSGCNSIQGFVDLKKAETISMNFVDGINLDRMPTEAILTYDAIKTRSTKEKVALEIKKILESEVDPFTKKPLGFVGLHTRIVRDIIEFLETGNVSKKTSTQKQALNQSEIEVLDFMRITAIKSSDTEERKLAIVSLYKKIRGIT